MWPRLLHEPLRRALDDTPCVVVHGPRQAGKTTLVRDLLPARGWTGRYITLDDASQLQAANADPAAFVAGLDGGVVIDEVQRAPSLLPAIKASIDRLRRPGRFVLTGSADVLAIPRLADDLVGRAEILTLWPLAQAEFERRPGTLIASLFAGELPAAPACDLADILLRVAAGGFPEAQGRSEPRRQAWFRSYLTMVIQRDVRDLGNVHGLTELPRLLALVAARSGGLLNRADLGRDSGLPGTTLERYLGLLEATFLVRLLPAWFSNRTKRLAKAPKLLVLDSGLAASLLGIDASGMARMPTVMGPLLEAFVASEVLKLAGAALPSASVLHFRTHAREEVDLVVEDADGRVVGIEVKAARTVRSEDFRGLRALQAACGGRFVRGIVLHPAADSVAFGERLATLPLSALWA